MVITEGRERGDHEEEKVVVVAVKAESDISRAALTWALTHLVRQGDVLTLLAVLPNASSPSIGGGWGRKLWSFAGFSGERGSRRRDRQQCQISASCSQMSLQIDGHNQVNVRIKVVGGGPTGSGVVAAESKRLGANWIVLDKQLKQEAKHCIEELQCNIVVIKGSNDARVMRLNLTGDTACKPTLKPTLLAPIAQARARFDKHIVSSTKTSSALFSSPSSIAPSLDISFHVHKHNPLFEKKSNVRNLRKHGSEAVCQDRHAFNSSDTNGADANVIPLSTSKTLEDRFKESDTRSPGLEEQEFPDSACNNTKAVISMFRSSPSMPPPLCSLCRHKAPVFGKPPRQFSYRELEEATDGFWNANLLADGATGYVHRGVLADGRPVVVKQLKAIGGLIGEQEFLAEMELLSRAQHRNVVLLVGYCIQGNGRVLVYEYICNGSLDMHLFGRECKAPLDWEARIKIAVGVARGLRYLHEDCRVGFVVHKDLRPNNILLTHDFEPIIGDFGIARCQGSISFTAGVRLHQTSNFGYSAPEYIEYGLSTEKTDVYTFGVLLLQLITGCRAMEPKRPKGQQLLTDWASPLLSLASEDQWTHLAEAMDHFLDPCLERNKSKLFLQQFQVMSFGAFICLHRDPHSRPSMSKVLGILEGDALTDPVIETKPQSVGSRSGRLNYPIFHPKTDSRMRTRGSLSLRFPEEAVSTIVYTDEPNNLPYFF